MGKRERERERERESMQVPVVWLCFFTVSLTLFRAGDISIFRKPLYHLQQGYLEDKPCFTSQTDSVQLEFYSQVLMT